MEIVPKLPPDLKIVARLPHELIKTEIIPCIPSKLSLEGQEPISDTTKIRHGRTFMQMTRITTYRYYKLDIGTRLECQGYIQFRRVRMPMTMVEVRHVNQESINNDGQLQGYLEKRYYRVVYVVYSFEQVKRWVRYVNKMLKERGLPANVRARMFERTEPMHAHWYYGKYDIWRYTRKKNWWIYIPPCQWDTFLKDVRDVYEVPCSVLN
jgi:hypothetical protein